MTQTEKHTPGPWVYNCGNNGAVVYKEDVGTIANVPDDLILSEANAKLIAAAPDMAEALRFLIDEYGEGGMLDAQPVIEKARAALAKAGIHD